MDLILARHGLSEWNVDPNAGPDSPLTEFGCRQAERLGRWLAARYTFTAFYASPLRRARRTAEIVNDYLNLPVVYDEDLREEELHYREELPRSPRPVTGLGAAGAVFSPRYAAFYERIARVARRIVELEPVGTVLIVAHGGSIGTLVRTLLGTHAVSFHTDNAATHHLRWANARWAVVFLNRNDYLAGLQREETLE